ncbi:Regulator of nonsense transcripts 1 like protein [Dictyocoela muelleri]|nr:Regulator of nonsense transcripts 1 like protein [Dictyocoela muelleri]
MTNCLYCQLPSNLVKCLECSKHFCNTRTTSSVSHIVFHLVKARHKRIEIDSLIKCDFCGESNIFLLGSLDRNFCCRKCSDQNEIRDKKKKIDRNGDFKLNDKWESLIEERCLVDWLVSTKIDSSDSSYDSDTKPAINLTKHQLLALEEKDKPKLPSTKKKYTPSEHIEILSELIKAEAESEKNIKESLTKYNINVRWVNNNRTCYFVINRDDIIKRINTGDEVKISGPDFSARGYVCNDSAYTEEVGIDVVRIKGSPPPVAEKIEFIWKNIGYERMTKALERFGKSCSRSLYKYILTGVKSDKKSSKSQKIEKILYPENLPNLNASQEIALKAALNEKLTLIQGPPGTGKTITCAAIVHNLVKQKKGKIFVVAPSNTAVDNLTKQIAKTGVNVVRVMSKSREWCDAGPLALHEMVKNYKYEKKSDEIKKCDTRKSDKYGESESDDEHSRAQKRKIEKKIIENADVVTCTCVTAGQRLFSGFKFPYVLIDEAVQSTEPLVVIPLTYGCRKLVMVGDHKQLGPTILDKRTEQAGLKISMFERLVSLGIHPYLLTVQYRMHPLLSEWPSNTFYNGSLMNGLSEISRTSVLKSATFFYVCYGREEVSSSGTSFLNQSETECVAQIINFLLKRNINPQNIGIITPYEGQRVNIARKLSSIFSSDNLAIDVSNVDAFQGREKDYIIVSLVRSNTYQGIGFVSDKRRLNVALTRAKRGLIIIGNPLTLMKNEMWKDLITFYQQKDLILEGDFNDLKKCMVVEQKKKIFDFKALKDLL